jgi:hypothetical protein
MPLPRQLGGRWHSTHLQDSPSHSCPTRQGCLKQTWNSLHLHYFSSQYWLRGHISGTHFSHRQLTSLNLNPSRQKWWGGQKIGPQNLCLHSHSQLRGFKVYNMQSSYVREETVLKTEGQIRRDKRVVGIFFWQVFQFLFPLPAHQDEQKHSKDACDQFSHFTELYELNFFLI